MWLRGFIMTTYTWLISLSLLVSLSQLVNNGPSRISHTLLQLKCPMRLQSNKFIYPLEVMTEGPVNCTTHNIINPLNLKVRRPGLTAGQRFYQGSPDEIINTGVLSVIMCVTLIFQAFLIKALFTCEPRETYQEHIYIYIFYFNIW